MTDTPARRRPLFAAALAGAAAIGGSAGAVLTLAAHDQLAPAPVVRPAVFHDAAFRPADGASLSDMVQAVLPSVVQLQVRQTAATPGLTAAPLDGPMGELFRQFFGDAHPGLPDPGDGDDGGGAVGEALGSGFVISRDGLIVTNDHVVRGGGKISVKLADGRELPATLVGHDAKTDLAVVRVAGGGALPAIGWGDSDRLRIGDDVLAVGSPFGLGGTVTRGIVSGRGRQIGEGPYDDFIQVDAAINQGNSGGPLFDDSGHVVGVNTAIYSPSGGNVGIGFAIPASLARSVVEQIVAHGAVARGQIGVSVQDVTADVADSLARPGLKGAIVAAVTAGSPAAHAGLRPGDIVTRFGGKPVSEARDLSRAVAQSGAGMHVPVHVVRGNGEADLDVVVAAMPGATAPLRRASYKTPADAASLSVLGLTLEPASPQLNREAGQPDAARGAVITGIEPASEGAARGLRPGDLIHAVNNAEVSSPREVAADIEVARHSGRHHVLLTVQRGDDSAFVAMPLA